MASNNTHFSKADESSGNIVPINRYVRIETVLLQYLGWQAAYLYALLAFKCGKNGKCWPRQATLADELGVTSRHVRRMLVTLQALGLVRSTRSRSCNFYEVYPVTGEWLAERSAEGRNVRPDRTSMSALDRTSVSDRKRKDHHQNLKEKPSELKPAASVVEAPREQKQHPPEVATSFRSDDEKPRTPEAEMEARMEARHPGWVACDRKACLQGVKLLLERNEIPLAEFLPYDRAHTTGKPSAFHNPHGYYIGLAKQMAKEKRTRMKLGLSDVVEQAIAAKPPEGAKDAHGRCASCHGAGGFADKTFCASCDLGRELEKMAARKVAKTVAA